jgi:mRNA-degrading endonuclease RelE of RelBE toxin-antitoxin system
MKVIWEPAAVRDLRRLDPPIAAQVRDAVQRFASTGQGDISALHGKLAGALRLRFRGWRIFLQRGSDDAFHILAIDKRGDAYR